MTDTQRPEELIHFEPYVDGDKDGYRHRLSLTLGSAAMLPEDAHFVAVGEQAIAELLERLDSELGPYFSLSKLGTLEYKRTIADARSAVDDMSQQEAVTKGPHRNIKHQIINLIAAELKSRLRTQGATFGKDEYRLSVLASKCRKHGLSLHEVELADHVMDQIGVEHVSDVIGTAELHLAIAEEVSRILTPNT